MSESYSIQEVGGTELARQYPDQGLIPDVPWHKAILTARKKASGWWRPFPTSERFFAVLSANTVGLRLRVSLDNFAIFIPWSEVSVSAERATPGTVVRLQMAAVPSVNLEFHLDDVAADALFSGVMERLPQRDPPGRIFWPKPWAVGVLVSVMFAAGGLLASLEMSWATRVVGTFVTAVAILLLWHAFRPIIEEDQ